MQQDELPRYHLNSLFTTTVSDAKPFDEDTGATGLSVTERRLTIDKTLNYYVTCITGMLTHMAGQNNIRSFYQFNIIYESVLPYFCIPAPGLPSGIPIRRFSPAPSSLQVFLPYSSRSRPLL